MNDIVTLATGAAVGALSGAHASIWGMYKDAIHEGFSPARFRRSILLGAAAGLCIQWVLQLDPTRAASLALLFGLAYAVERGLVETWKTFIRNEDQSKYFIPMQFSIGGQPVRHPLLRVLAGMLYVTIVAAILAFIASLDARIGPPTVLRAALVGLVVGVIVAVGGGWKDAPKEGFDLLKFFRSPIMTVMYAALLSRMTGEYLLIAAAAIGYERATAETWKTFFFPSKPRGKFTGKPVTHPEMLARRQRFVPAYLAISAAAIACIGGALAP